MRRQIINEAWNEYSKVLPNNCSSIQRVETRRAFYAGASMIMEKVITGLSSGDDVEDSDLDLLTDLQAESLAFLDAVVRGAA